VQNAKCKVQSRRKRRRGYVCLAVFAAVCIITSFVRATSVEYTTMEVVVQEGDCLWSIWEDVGYGRADKWIAEVKKMNEQDLSVLRPYSRIAVPVIK